MNNELKMNLDGVEILDSWFEDLDALEEKLKEIKRHISKVKKERKEQPYLILKDPLGKNPPRVVTQYRLFKREEGGGLLSENYRDATEEEIAWMDEQEMME